MEDRFRSRPKGNVDDLLMNGFWKPSRKAPLSDPAYDRSASNCVPTPKSNSAKRRPHGGWPPQPAVEEEHEALAKEHLATEFRASIIACYDPPFRGAVDQQPILLEADVDAAKLCDEQHPDSKDKDCGEWRFILIPKADTFPQTHQESRQPRKPFVEHRPTAKDDPGVRTRTTQEVPPIERRRSRSRSDLPSIRTNLDPQPAHFRRTSDAHRSDSTGHGRVPSTDALLSPDVALYRGTNKGHLESSSVSPSRRTSFGSSEAIANGRPRSGSSTRPTTPTHEKKPSSSSDAYRESLSRAQTVLEENANRHSDGRSSSRVEHLDADHGRSYRKNSRTHGRSSNEDLEFSDSERERGDHRSRRSSKASRPDAPNPRSPRLQPETWSSNRYVSPLPSPKVSPSQISPPDRPSDVRESRRPSPRPVSPTPPYPESPRSSGNSLGLPSAAPQMSRSRRPSTSDNHAAKNMSSTLPMTIPTPTKVNVQSHHESHRSPTMTEYDRHGNPTPSPSPKPYWQPSQFEPPETNAAQLERPLGSYRRYSLDVEDGNVAPLPPCPRSSPIHGYIDWLTLPKTPSFNICFSCYKAIFEPTEFRTHFVPAPVRSLHDEIVCDFGSQLWFRIAWLLLRKEQRRDLNLLRSIAEITETAPPCLGNQEAVRKWYSIVDPKTGNLIRNFDVCYSCVRCIETLLPPLKGIFVRADLTGPPGAPRVCDMRFDSKRFVQYFDALEGIAETSSKYRVEPNTEEFAELAKHFSSTPECLQDRPLQDDRWHVITQLPEFTVCPECFDEVVLPELTKRKAIPAMFNKSLQQIPSASCQLYSERMRTIFDKAVNADDYKLLATKARDRHEMELELKSRMADLRRQGRASGKDMRALEAEWARWE